MPNKVCTERLGVFGGASYPCIRIEDELANFSSCCRLRFAIHNISEAAHCLPGPLHEEQVADIHRLRCMMVGGRGNEPA